MQKIITAVSPGTLFVGVLLLLIGPLFLEGTLRFQNELFNLGVVLTVSGLFSQVLIRYFRRRARGVTAS